FDQQAAGYDRQWAKTAPIRDCLYFLLEPLLAPLPAEARVLCVGVGTGQEMAHLAAAHPGWSFTAVEPSGAMLEACRQRADAEGFATRCRFHHGFLETLPADAPYDAATCFLVSQFITARAERVRFFSCIASRLRPAGQHRPGRRHRRARLRRAAARVAADDGRRRGGARGDRTHPARLLDRRGGAAAGTGGGDARRRRVRRADALLPGRTDPRLDLA